jgi:NAD(P)H-hydrate epimerase
MAAVVRHINNSGLEIIAIDIPTGMSADKSSQQNIIIRAGHTLSFQCYKLAFLMEENQEYIGRLHILHIGLHEDYIKEATSSFHLTDAHLVRSMIRRRNKFSHKGDYGHGALITGSRGMMGASVLCSKAFMRSGAGKLTCHIPASGNVILQIAIPEAMSRIEEGDDHIASVSSMEKYDAVGIGPGLGLYDSHAALLSNLFEQNKKSMVIDADALNILSRNIKLLKNIPPLSILTPHTREFERLFGKFTNDFQKIEGALEKAKEFNIIIVLKGPYTFIATPSGTGYFNTTGNPGMATGGSGDVLTGFITGLLSQGYPSDHAAIAGVFIHGLAGDLAAAQLSEHSMIASDITDHLGAAFLTLQ